ncbi:MAG: ABC transporter ATP-binding protein [Dehalococcoidia bacterium]
MGAIVTEGLTKAYGPTLALDGLDLVVDGGEIFGFLGPNGAGKTTTIRLLLDLIRPTAGRAAVLGHDCQRESLAVRSAVGYLPGDLRLYPGLTGRETIDYVAGLRERPVDEGYVRELVDRLDLDLSRKVATYSKGNRQKLGVVLALLDRPPVLLLDEPTSGLDPLLQHAVWQVLRARANEGATVFFSSHVLSEVEQVCERVGFLREGRLVAVEPVAALKRRARRRMHVRFANGQPPPGAFDLPGVSEVARTDGAITFETAGDMDPFIKALAQYHVVDLHAEEATLDDIMLAFYEREG